MVFRDAFSRNPFMIGYGTDLFSRDRELGYRFPLGRLVGHARFVPLGAAIRHARSAEMVVLNMGDSSTSGWNGDNVYGGVADPEQAFFTYKTYAQLLEERWSCTAINAGVPGYSSFQGKKYQERLLRKLAQAHVSVRAVTLFFGNNDATYNGAEDKVALGQATQTAGEFRRVSIGDYIQNMREMIDLANSLSITPILISPVVNHYWKPGLRSRRFPGEFPRALSQLKDDRVMRDLGRACELYSKGEFEAATELDCVLPRAKRAYIVALRDLAESTRTRLIDIQPRLSASDRGKYFADYCHPREPANLMIADEVAGIVGLSLRESWAIADPQETILERFAERCWRTLRTLTRWLAPAPQREPEIYPFY